MMPDFQRVMNVDNDEQEEILRLMMIEEQGDKLFEAEMAEVCPDCGSDALGKYGCLCQGDANLEDSYLDTYWESLHEM